MKKKLISTLLIVALVLCAVPVAFPGISTVAHAQVALCCGDNPCSCGHTRYPEAGSDEPGPSLHSEAEPEAEPEAEEKREIDYHERLFVWVERTRNDEGERADYVKAELVPVDEEDREEYLKRFKDFTSWEEDESSLLYSPIANWISAQLWGHLAKIDAEHVYSGYTVVEIGLIDEDYNVPGGAVYYEHKALESELDFSLSLRIGELKILLPEEYTKQDFSFAARPDGSGGYEIILKDSDGNDIEYTIVE